MSFIVIGEGTSVAHACNVPRTTCCTIEHFVFIL
jgi:hypothetical protein